MPKVGVVYLTSKGDGMTLQDVLKSGAWIKFEFMDGEFEGRKFPRAAMVVKALDKRSGMRLKLQVDTGMPTNVLHDNVVPPCLGIEPVPDAFPLTLEFDGNFSTEAEFASTSRYLPSDTADGRGDSDGTVGMSLFGGHGFAIDYPAERLYLLSEAQLDAIAAGFSERFAPYISRIKSYSVILLPVVIDGHALRAFFDTGGGMLDLVVDRGIWAQLTGVPTDAPTNDIFQVPAWGKRLDIVAAPVQCDICVPGGDCLPISMAHTLPAGGLTYATIGNKPFLDSIVVVNFRDQLFGRFPGGTLPG